MQELNGLKLHHVGFAVRSIEQTKPSFEVLGTEFYHSSVDEDRNLQFLFGRVGGVTIELVSPIDETCTCAVSNIISKQACTPYHMCYETNNFCEDFEKLKRSGFRQVGKVIESQLYGYDAIGVFLFSREMGLIELVMECK